MVEHDRLAVGQILDGKYQIESVIDRGGMGVVYRARHLGLGGVRAIKLIHPRFAESEDFLRRFRNEARLAEGLHHPNLVTLYDLSPFPDGSFYLVLEYVEGTTLASLLNEGLVLGFPDVANIIDQTAQGLEFAHAQKIIHRDISPDNMMLTRDRDGRTRVKILDFGIAKAFGDVGTVDVQRTATGTFLGKIGYCSPEQIGLREDEQLDQRTDVFSLAVVAYKLIAGSLPFSTSSVRTYVYEITMAPEREVRARYEKDLPSPLRAAVTRALRRDRRERTSTVAELRDELLNAVAAATASNPDRGDAILDSIDLSRRSRQELPPASGMPIITGGGGAPEVGADDVTVVIPPVPVPPVMDDTPTELRREHPPASDVAPATVHRPITTRRPIPAMPADSGRWSWAAPIVGVLLLGLVGMWLWNQDGSSPAVVEDASRIADPSFVPDRPDRPAPPAVTTERDSVASSAPSSSSTEAESAAATTTSPVLAPAASTTVSPTNSSSRRAPTSTPATIEPAPPRPGTQTRAPSRPSPSPPSPASTTTSRPAPAVVPSPVELVLVSVSSEPSAEVVIDGEPVGETPLEISLRPGEHLVELRVGGRERWSQRFTAETGRPISFDPRLDVYGSLSVTADVWANVRLDDGVAGQTPVLFRRLIVGPHRIVVDRPGYREQSFSVEVREGETTTLRITMEPQP